MSLEAKRRRARGRGGEQIGGAEPFVSFWGPAKLLEMFRVRNALADGRVRGRRLSEGPRGECRIADRELLSVLGNFSCRGIIIPPPCRCRVSRDGEISRGRTVY